ncbi:alpha-galactosidase [Sesbania bispinosa]|nr:alpha-galactosidase [Sesbania bispinosa]
MASSFVASLPFAKQSPPSQLPQLGHEVSQVHPRLQLQPGGHQSEALSHNRPSKSSQLHQPFPGLHKGEAKLDTPTDSLSSFHLQWCGSMPSAFIVSTI